MFTKYFSCFSGPLPNQDHIDLSNKLGVQLHPDSNVLGQDINFDLSISQSTTLMQLQQMQSMSSQIGSIGSGKAGIQSKDSESQGVHSSKLTTASPAKSIFNKHFKDEMLMNHDSKYKDILEAESQQQHEFHKILDRLKQLNFQDDLPEITTLNNCILPPDHSVPTLSYLPLTSEDKKLGSYLNQAKQLGDSDKTQSRRRRLSSNGILTGQKNQKRESTNIMMSLSFDKNQEYMVGSGHLFDYQEKHQSDQQIDLKLNSSASSDSSRILFIADNDTTFDDQIMIGAASLTTHNQKSSLLNKEFKYNPAAKITLTKTNKSQIKRQQITVKKTPANILGTQNYFSGIQQRNQNLLLSQKQSSTNNKFKKTSNQSKSSAKNVIMAIHPSPGNDAFQYRLSLNDQCQSKTDLGVQPFEVLDQQQVDLGSLPSLNKRKAAHTQVCSGKKMHVKHHTQTQFSPTISGPTSRILQSLKSPVMSSHKKTISSQLSPSILQSNHNYFTQTRNSIAQTISQSTNKKLMSPVSKPLLDYKYSKSMIKQQDYCSQRGASIFTKKIKEEKYKSENDEEEFKDDYMSVQEALYDERDQFQQCSDIQFKYNSIRSSICENSAANICQEQSLAKALKEPKLMSRKSMPTKIDQFSMRGNQRKGTNNL